MRRGHFLAGTPATQPVLVNMSSSKHRYHVRHYKRRQSPARQQRRNQSPSPGRNPAIETIGIEEIEVGLTNAKLNVKDNNSDCKQSQNIKYRVTRKFVRKL